MASFRVPEPKTPPKPVIPPGDADLWTVGLRKVPAGFVVFVQQDGETKVVSPSPGPLHVAANEIKKTVARLLLHRGSP